MRGNELLDQMALVDPAYVAAADVAPKKKNRTIWKAVAAIFCVVLCGGLISYIFPFLSPGNPPPDKHYYPFDYVCYFDGHDVYAYMTGLTTAESYTAPDGTEYLPEDGGEIWIVKGKLHIDPWYILSEETHLRNGVFKGNIPLYCEPIIEENENGESAVTLLFCVKETDYRSGMKTGLDGYLELELSTENPSGDRRRNTFVLEDFGGSPNPPYKPIV